MAEGIALRASDISEINDAKLSSFSPNEPQLGWRKKKYKRQSKNDGSKKEEERADASNIAHATEKNVWSKVTSNEFGRRSFIPSLSLSLLFLLIIL